jgi:hypothetical protein
MEVAMYQIELDEFYTSSIKSIIDHCPYIKKEVVRFYLGEAKENISGFNPLTVSEVLDNNKLFEKLLIYITDNVEIDEFLETFEKDIKREEYDLLFYYNSLGAFDFKVSLSEIRFENKEEYLKFLAKTWDEFKPTQEEIAAAIIEKQL